ncbi:ferredoxin--NADP reductase [Aestuariivirga litoralis]|uniref:ferredoxin--NADP reductase n=1 Tax=Aestuariivirga litoralis TaxID=2650924 RepID=UPI0018C47719|nr:ferredoxin--NADP reductase [Aestuariivirga litoralis]MBG1233054.1 ferredoxin--NADP reductase [Aestuariivirga litoralis]
MTLNSQGLFEEKVLEIQHYTDRLFRFRITRPQSFRFRSGEFVMIGLPINGKNLMRAYSVASPSWDESLEFYSIKVQDGPLTSHLQNIKVGDTILMRQKTTGTLVHDALLPGKRLFMISTGTGVAPFASVMRDPETYEKFETVILAHTCRDAAELKYGFDTVEVSKNDPLVGEQAAKQLFHFASTTREKTAQMGRITTLIENGGLFTTMGIAALNPQEDRLMMCGSMAMIKDMKALLEARGFVEGSLADPGSFVIERAFVG